MTPDFDAVATKHGVSRSAIETLASALKQGNGMAAQFNHPELGGMGQWMPGMVMIGDMFNHALKAKVDAICRDLLPHIAAMPTQPAWNMTFTQWWDESFGMATQSGEQNGTKYAYFASHKRLLIQRHGVTRTFNTGSHTILGIAQQQSNISAHLVFRTESGVMSENDFELL